MGLGKTARSLVADFFEAFTEGSASNRNNEIKCKLCGMVVKVSQATNSNAYRHMTVSTSSSYY